MSRNKFKQNLVEALIHHDCDLPDEDIERFLDLNYDEDSSLEDWTFADFNSFAIDVSCDGLRDACHYLDLHHWEDDEDEDDDIDWDDPLEDFDKEDDDLLNISLEDII